MLQWIEGYESYSNLIGWVQYRYPLYNVPNAAFAPGRAIGNSFLMNGNTFGTSNFSNTITYIVGFAFQNINLSNANINMPVVDIRDSTTPQITLAFNPNTKLFSVLRGTTVLGTGTFVITTGAWYYIEISVTISPTVGAVTSRVNQINDVVLTGINTQVSGNTYAQNIAFRGPTASGLGGGYLIDDMYINDGTGSANNTFLGDMKVEAVNVIAGGHDTEWGVNLPNIPNYQAVQVLADGLWIQSNTPGNIDTYVTSALNRITGSIAGVSAVYWARNTDSTQHTIASQVYTGATEYPGTSFAINNTAFMGFSYIWPQDPSTSAPWAVSGVNAAEFGVNLIS